MAETGVPNFTTAMRDELIRQIDGLSNMGGFRLGLTSLITAIIAVLTEGETPTLVANNTGGTLAPGTPVYVSSLDANLVPEVTLADANVFGRACQLIIAESIADGGTGLALGVGMVEGVDTSAWAADTVLWLSATVGTLTDTMPTASIDVQQRCAVVETQHATLGQLRVFPEQTSLQGVGTSNLQDGIFSADAAGRAKVAASFFGAGVAASGAHFADNFWTNTLAGKFAAGFLTNTEVDRLADGFFAADAASRAKFADGIWDNSVVAKFADGLFAADDASRAKFAASFLGNSATGRALVEAGFFDAATVLAKFAAGSVDNTAAANMFAAGAFTNAEVAVFADAFLAADDASRAKLAADFLGNSAIGRGLMEDGFFDAATALAKVAASAFDNTFTDSAFAAAAFAADADSRAKFADNIWVVAKLADDLLEEMLCFPVPGTWASDGDGARTNGGGLVGDDAALAACQACKGQDGGSYADIATISGEAGYTADYQMLPDVPVNGDSVILFFAVPVPEIAFDLSQLATWTGDAGKWQYSDGAGSWADATLSTKGDQTDTTAQDAKQPWQQVGATTFVPPGAAWVEVTIDGETGYALQWIVTDATKVNQLPILNSVLPDVVSPEDGYAVKGKRTVSKVRLTDQAATLHTTADVKFMLWNFTTGEGSGELTFAQNKKTDKWTLGSALACADEDIVGVIVTQEDTAAEVTNGILELETTRVD